MCLAAPAVTGKGHRKIQPKAKHFPHCKKNQSSWPNQTDSSKRITKISNHTGAKTYYTNGFKTLSMTAFGTIAK